MEALGTKREGNVNKRRIKLILVEHTTEKNQHVIKGGKKRRNGAMPESVEKCEENADRIVSPRL